MPHRVALLLVCALFSVAFFGCSFEERQRGEMESISVSAQAGSLKEIIRPEGVPSLPVFSPAVRSGGLIFLSGAIGARPGVNPPELVAGGVIPETHQTMENIITVLDAAGAALLDLIKCTVFLADISDYAAVNEVYIQYFPSDPPARSAVAGSGLALGARVEIECIAAVPEA